MLFLFKNMFYLLGQFISSCPENINLVARTFFKNLKFFIQTLYKNSEMQARYLRKKNVSINLKLVCECFCLTNGRLLNNARPFNVRKFML